MARCEARLPGTFMPDIQIRPCGSPGPINVARLAQALVPVRWPGVRQVANRGLDAPSADAPHAPASVRGELVDWAAAIVARRASQAADRLLPGIAVVHHACQACRALTAVRQGDLRRAMQQIPLGAMIPASLAAGLRNALPPSCAAALRSLPDHDTAVLLLAAGAVLWPPAAAQAPAAAMQAATLRLVRCARGSLEGLRGLRAVLSPAAGMADAVPVPARSALPAASGPATMPCNASRPTRVPATASALQVRHTPLARQEAPGGAWPFAGAAAAPAPGRRDGAAPPPAKSQKGSPGQAGQGRSAGLHRGNALRRRVQSGTGRRTSMLANEERPSMPGNKASRNPAAMAGHAEGAKESMQNPLKHAAAGYADGDGYIKREEPLPPSRPGDLGAGPGRGRQRADDLWRRTAEGAAGRLPAGGRPLPAAAAGQDSVPMPACIQFDDVRVLSLLVRSRRYQPSLMHVCVPSQDTPLFKEWVTLPADSHRGLGRWMVSEAIHEDVPRALRAAPVCRYGGPAGPTLETGPTIAPIGSDRLFTLLTMSLLDAPLRREAGNQQLLHMQANSFRVLQHRGLDGIERYYLAYFLRRESAAHGSVRGGFLEVWAGAGGTLGVDDGVRDIRIMASSLDALVLTLEKLTGLRYLGPRRDTGAGVMPSPAANLFVDDEQILASGEAARHLPFNHALQVFAPVTVEVPGHDAPVQLYHSSFQRVGDTLAYADDTGHSGMLRFGRHRVGKGARQLRCPTPADDAFAARHGLQQGVFYTTTDVEQALEHGGLVNLGGGETDDSRQEDRPPRPPLRPDAIVAATTSTTPGPWPASFPVRSSFHFHDGRLDYVDHDGRSGSLVFERVPRTLLPRYRLPEQQRPEQQFFAARNNFVPSVAYSQDDVEWLLGGQGYVRRPD